VGKLDATSLSSKGVFRARAQAPVPEDGGGCRVQAQTLTPAIRLVGCSAGLGLIALFLF
jgi:hypothetical protein